MLLLLFLLCAPICSGLNITETECTISVQCPPGNSCKHNKCTPFIGVYRNTCEKPSDCPLEYECDINIKQCVVENCAQDSDCPNLGPGSYALCSAGQCTVGDVQNASLQRSELLQVYFAYL